MNTQDSGWWGKVAGAGFGYLLGGPIGALLGGWLGHKLDKSVARVSVHMNQQQQTQTTFFTAVFGVLGHISKADGTVSREEIQVAESLMQQMRLNPEQRDLARNLFRQGKSADFPLADVLQQLKYSLRSEPNLRRMFLEIQLTAALADGEVSPAEQALLRRVAEGLGFSARDYEHLFRQAAAGQRAAHRQQSMSLSEAYRILDAAEDWSDRELKKRYRRLMSQHHPDKLVSKGLPEEMMQLAKEKTQQVQQAWQLIEESRRSQA